MKKTLRNTLALVVLVAMTLCLLAGCGAKKKVEWEFENTLDYAVRVIYAADDLNIVLQPQEKQTIELTAQASKDRAEFRIEKADDPSVYSVNKSYAILEIGGIFTVYSLDGKTPTIFQTAYNSPLYQTGKG